MATFECHPLPLTASTIVASWTDAYEGVAHISAGSPEHNSLCVAIKPTQVQIAKSVILSRSALHLLAARPGQDVIVTPVKPLSILVRASTTRMPASEAVVCEAVAASIGFPSCYELVLIPDIYEKNRLNLRCRIVSVVPNQTPDELVVYLDPTHLPNGAAIGHYARACAVSAEQSKTVSTLAHPGFLFLNHNQMESAGLAEGNIVEFKRRREHSLFLEVRGTESDNSQTAYFESDETDSANRDFSLFGQVKKLDGVVCWAAKQPVNDVQSKARASVTLSQSCFGRGYLEGETIDLLVRTNKRAVTLAGADKSLGEHEIGLTPLLLRELNLRPGCGLFVQRRTRLPMMAKVGIFNIEDVGRFSAIGSDHLSSQFDMPSMVELRNPKSSTSIDIMLERDLQARREPMVRMSRSVRELLLVHRGDSVLITHIDQPPTPLPSRISDWFQRQLDWALEFLIGSRTVYMSVSPAEVWDDEARVARVSPETLAVLGVQPGDRVQITYRQKHISRMLLPQKPPSRDDIPRAQEMLSAGHLRTDESVPYFHISPTIQLNLDAQGRYELGSGHVEFGTVVAVARDKKFFLRKSLNLSIFSVIGTVITIVALFRTKPIWLQSIVGVVVALTYFYLSLSVERSKVQ